jgi:hypothetical protein
MYLKFECELDLISLGKILVPESTDDSLDWDYENVYEWMYLDFPDLEYSLNVSREHGQADIDDELLDDPQFQIKPGAIYVHGCSRSNVYHNDYYMDTIPEWVAQYIANCLSVDVLVYGEGINIDLPDKEPIAVMRPQTKTA